MRAAVVESFEQLPRYGNFEEPEAGEGEVLVTVSAAALSNLVKAQARGAHYSSGKQFPLVPGNDGVGRMPDGQRVYFLAPRAPFGSMAERTIVPREHTLTLPEEVDDITAAALGNPGLASWGALIGRARLQVGECVLVNGATGVSGRQAVQVAKYLGARRVIATGRDAASLAELRTLGADETIQFDDSADALRERFRSALFENGGTQVVLDFLFGRSAELILESIAGRGSADGEPRVRFVQVGSASGRQVQMQAEWLRSSGLELLGSGLGSLSMAEILSALRRMYDAYREHKFAIDTEPVSLEQVGDAWAKTESGRRTVFTL